MRLCEIIYVQEPKGWKWRALAEEKDARRESSKETFELFYECVSAARAKGYKPNVKCL